MSGKHLSLIKQDLSSPTSAQAENTSKNKLDQFVEDLLKPKARGNNTVDEILNNPQVKKHGILGRLSSSQQNLVTSVVSIMQDRISSDAKQNADALKQIIIFEREALASMSKSFAATAKSLYQLPLLATLQKNERDISTVDENGYHTNSYGAEYAGGGGAKTPSRFAPFLTWGNLFAVTAILMAVLVVKTSVSTANFETKYHLTQQNLDQLKQEFEKQQISQQQLITENKTLAEKSAALSSRQDETDKQQVAEKSRFDIELQEAKQTIIKQQQLIEQSAQVNASIKQNLNGEISALQQELASLKGKESQQDENSSMWKKLAEERKVEISKLQTELLNRDSATTDKKADAKFLGLF